MKSRSSILMLVSLIMLISFGCKDDKEDNVMPAGQEKTYQLTQLANSGVSGTVTFRKQDNTTTIITVKLAGTQAGNSHPAHIHSGNASTGGPIVLDFNPVDGGNGMSVTNVTHLNDGTAITYEELITFDGHVNIHKSAQEIAIMIAQGNIGSNVPETPAPGTNPGTGGY